jgi:mannose-6-phosphate isomerase-like protein (cupin superfamily)
MKKIVLTLVFAAPIFAQASGHAEPRGAATYVSSSEIQATVAKTQAAAVNDTQVRVVGINDAGNKPDYNVAIGVLHRGNTAKNGAGGGLEHEFVTEVYQIVSGSGTFVTGGFLENPKASPPESTIVKLLDGPSTTGGPVKGGESRKVGPGDMIVIPPNTPHWFSEITTDQVVYTVVRIDPRKILPAGYDASKLK